MHASYRIQMSDPCTSIVHTVDAGCLAYVLMEFAAKRMHFIVTGLSGMYVGRVCQGIPKLN